MAVAQIASLLILTALTLGDPATRAYRECKGQLQLPTSAQLPEWCQKMRFEVADCIVARLGFEDDDGSVSLRGRVLLETYKRSGDDDLYTDLKLYHYGCVYNSWHNFVDDKCFKKQLWQL
ncbi:unnamed protein product [Nippostrongylus brasiliensis]|uniref:Conserved secreted protein n=1 Tax=Nippostrongylus brasiliensis TaxID=27835 RepID=A0A0N4XVY6_NIPBR|nr:unnamed protein product [Nippostrongylus brasiliensis]